MNLIRAIVRFCGALYNVICAEREKDQGMRDSLLRVAETFLSVSGAAMVVVAVPTLIGRSLGGMKSSTTPSSALLLVPSPAGKTPFLNCTLYVPA